MWKGSVDVRHRNRDDNRREDEQAAEQAAEHVCLVCSVTRLSQCRAALRTAKASTLDLAKQVMVADLRELQAATADMPEATAKARRQQIGTRLRRLKLGTTTTLQTVQWGQLPRLSRWSC